MVWARPYACQVACIAATLKSHDVEWAWQLHHLKPDEWASVGVSGGLRSAISEVTDILVRAILVMAILVIGILVRAILVSAGVSGGLRSAIREVIAILVIDILVFITNMP